MKKAPIPPDEKARRQALEHLRVLDTPDEEAFDRITQLAAALCGTKIALVSLVDTDRQWFKARTGLAARQTPRDISFCGHAILGTEILEIRDPLLDPSFCDNPLVTGDPKIRFYAGAPLVTSEGHRIGTLCVIHDEPRSLNDLQRMALTTLATQVVALLEVRLYRDSVHQVLSQLQEAQRISKIGSWQYNLVTQEQTWSSEHYRIFEIPEPQPQEALFRMYRERIHPEDLPELDRLIHRALHQGEDFVYDHRVYLEGGKRIKFVQGIGKVTLGADGRPIMISGTCRDKTEDVIHENRYSSLIDNMNEGLIVRNSDGKIVEFNRAALRILDMTAEQLAGHAPFHAGFRVIREDGSDLPESEHPARIALKTNRPVANLTLGLKLAGDQTRWIRANAVPIDSPQGRLATLTFSDITPLIEAQAENRFILNSLGIGIWKYDPTTLQLKWDDSMYRLYEMDPSHFSEDYDAWHRSLAPETAATTNEALQLALRGEQEFNLTFEIQTPSGKRKHIAARAEVVLDDHSRPRMMYGINWDRSKEVEMERYVQQERTKALHHAKMASLGEMAAGVAHEINNPLAVIQANTYILQRCRDDEAKFTSRSESIVKATERIAKIVRGLRKFSRSSDEKVRNLHSLQNIATESLVMTEPKAMKHAVQIFTDITADSSVLCDPLEIEQVLVNLVNNAIDAVSKLEERWVRISLHDQDGTVVLKVTDSGPGIPHAIEQKLFQPFFTTKAVGEGTGLGLSVSKGILDEHGATISLDHSCPNTRFEIRFPKHLENH